MSTTTPRLRSDLRSEPVEDAQGVLYFDVSDPKSGGVLRLFDFEWLLAQKFDGQRGFDEVARLADKDLGVAANSDDIKVYAERLGQLGLLEGIGCASCHLINAVETTPLPPPTYKVKPGEMLYGPYTDPEENLVHPATQVPLFRGANFCTSCHFDKVKDVTQKDLPGEILHGTICQDCHMEPSTGSSTSRRGAMTRAIGRHWFRGVVIPGTLLKNRNLQAEWMPRIDIDAGKSGAGVEGTVLVKVGSLPHSFPDGDPVLKQFFLSITTKDAQGRVLGEEIKQFGLPYEKILRGPIPDPFIKGGNTRRVPFSQTLPADGGEPATIEVVLSYALIPEPEPELKAKYLATLLNDQERAVAKKVIEEYIQPRVLTYRAKSL